MDNVFARYGVDRAEVAKELGVRYETVRLWCRGEQPQHSGRHAPPTSRPNAKNAIALEEKFGIPRWETRPDLWPPPSDRSPPFNEPPPGGDKPHTLAAA